MTANQARAAIITGFAIVGAALVGPCVDNHWAHLIGAVAESIVIAVSLLFIVAVITLNVHERLNGENRDSDGDASTQATGIQALPFGTYEDGEPVTFFFPEGGER